MVVIVKAGMTEVDASQVLKTAAMVASHDGDGLVVESLLKSLIVSDFLDNRQTVPSESRNVICVLSRKNSKLSRSVADPLGTLNCVLDGSASNFRISSAKLRKIRKQRKRLTGLSSTNLCN